MKIIASLVTLVTLVAFDGPVPPPCLSDDPKIVSCKGNAMGEPQKPVSISLITAAQVAKKLGVPESWVREHCRGRCEKQLPHVRLGKYVRFIDSKIDEWIAGQAEGGK
jgi:predicted DNA-binding transcriptional regulator AlpA